MTRLSSLEEWARRNGRDIEAYQFILDGLQHATARYSQDAGERRHIKADQLLDGLSEYALDKFGQLAPVVFGAWGVRGSEDIGSMVWEMIELGYLRSSDDDTPEDFLEGPDFNDRLRRGASEVFKSGRSVEE